MKDNSKSSKADHMAPPIKQSTLFIYRFIQDSQLIWVAAAPNRFTSFPPDRSVNQYMCTTQLCNDPSIQRRENVSGDQNV